MATQVDGCIGQRKGLGVAGESDEAGDGVPAAAEGLPVDTRGLQLAATQVRGEQMIARRQVGREYPGHETRAAGEVQHGAGPVWARRVRDRALWRWIEGDSRHRLPEGSLDSEAVAVNGFKRVAGQLVVELVGSSDER